MIEFNAFMYLACYEDYLLGHGADTILYVVEAEGCNYLSSGL